MITIEDESKSRIRLATNQDYFSKRYKTSSGIYTFTSPSLWTIEKNLFFLLKNSRKEEFKSIYKMKPDYLSFDEYGTVTLDYLLMYVNFVYKIEDFDLINVIIPEKDAIVEICYDKYSKVDKNSLEEINI